MIDELWDETYVKLEALITYPEQTKNRTKNLYDCSKQIYDGLSAQDINIYPKYLTVKCFDIDIQDFNQGIVPKILVKKCEGKGCKSEKEMEVFMKTFQFYYFVKIDATDYSSKDLTHKYKYVPENMTLSLDYHKKNIVQLKEVMVDLYRGIFL